MTENEEESVPLNLEGLTVSIFDCAGKRITQANCRNATIFNANFENAVFDCEADFSHATFLEEVDFSGAWFKKKVSFRKANFGKEYKTDFGNKDVCFSQLIDTRVNDKIRYFIHVISGKDTVHPKFSFEEIGQESISDDVLRKLGLKEFAKEIKHVYRIANKNPADVSFQNCIFGNLDFAKIPDDALLRAIRSSELEPNDKSGFEKYYPETTGNEKTKYIESYPNVGRVIISCLEAEEIKKAIAPSGIVQFNEAKFFNNGNVSFVNASFINEGGIWFDEAFFRNTETVSFGSARFINTNTLRLVKTRFYNRGDVSFENAEFANELFFWDVNAAFCNGGEVNFKDLRLKQNRPLTFTNVIWANGVGYRFSIKSAPETMDVRFIECLFLCGHKVIFANTRFPEKGTVSFTRCLFSSPSVSFEYAKWGHAVFEGGEIEWVSELLKTSASDTESQEDSKKKKIRLDEILRCFKHPPALFRGDREVESYTNVFSDETFVDWRSISIESAKGLLFRLVYLGKSMFDGVTLKHIELNVPKWLNQAVKYRQGWMPLRYEKRNCLYADNLWTKAREEKPPPEDQRFRSELKDVINQYTQLKSNLEGYRDFRGAGDFHYGEQEVLRRGYRWMKDEITRGEWFLRGLYYRSSGYGERPLKALVALGVIFMVLMVGGYTAFKMDAVTFDIIKDADSRYSALVKLASYSIAPFWKAFKIKEITSANWLYYIFLLFGNVLFYIQLAMLALAVRRRFKR